MEVRAQGLSYDRIAKRLRVSKSTPISWSREFKIEIENFRAVQLSHIREQYLLTKLKRLRLFGQSLNALKAQLNARDLSDLQSEKLLELILKYGAAIKEEESNMRLCQKLADHEAACNSIDQQNTISWQG